MGGRLHWRGWNVSGALLIITAMVAVSDRAMADPGSGGEVLARGGGRTIIQGGTGAAGGFLPVVTNLAFHAEKTGGIVTGDLECLALVPSVASGPGSGQFTVNAMYVTGPVTAAVIKGDTATLSGTATITGLGAGSSVPFTLVVKRGGPGATAVLTTGSLVFHEILLEGSFQVSSGVSKE